MTECAPLTAAVVAAEVASRCVEQPKPREGQMPVRVHAAA